nr:Down syndrome cell adhesion molecule-like protein 1 homolog [Ciona intestinalis]|eukprot:XP_009861727.2 Down syndrome cell adhesion molecule-like protein 1 homolog [Ciona intestinalis]
MTIMYFIIVTSAIIICVQANLNVTSGFDSPMTFDPDSNFTLRCRFRSDSDVTISWLRDGDVIAVGLNNGSETDEATGVGGARIGGDFTPLSIYKYTPSTSTETKTSRSVGRSNDDDTRHNRVSSVIFREDGDQVGELRVVGSNLEDGGIITCSASNARGERVEHAGRIVIKGPMSIRQLPPREVLSGSDVTITCSVLGSASWRSITWFKRTGLHRTPLIFTNRIQSLGTSLHIRDVQVTDQGKYQCQVEGHDKVKATMTTELSVLELPVIGPIVLNQEAYKVNDLVIMTCSVKKDDEPIRFKWVKNGQPITTEDSGVQIFPLGQRISSLVIEQVSLKMAGNYSCVTSNRAGSASEHTKLIVREPPSILSLKLPATVALYSDVTMSCVVRGFPLPKVTWYKYNVDVSGKVFVPTSNITRNVTSLKLTSYLTLRNVSYADDGLYECFANNMAGVDHNMISMKAHAPARISNFSNLVEIGSGQPVSLRCATRGDGSLNITWYKDGNLIGLTKSARIWTTVRNSVTKTGTHNTRKLNKSVSHFHFSVTSQQDAGLYTCLVKNKFGEHSMTSRLIVHGIPDPPSDVTIVERGSNFLRFLIFQPNNTGGLPVTSYILEYKALRHDDVEETVVQHEIKLSSDRNLEFQPYHVDALECGSWYEFNVTSVNPVGESHVFTLLGRTIGEAPVIASVKDLVTSVNQTSMMVDLSTWHNGGCPITGITLEYSGDVRSVNYSRTMNKTKIIVSSLRKLPLHDLHPGTWYKLRISSCNVVGCNDVTHSVATLDAAGMTLADVTLKGGKGGLLLHYVVPMVIGFGLVILLLLILLRYRYKQQMKKHRRMKEAQKMADSLLGSNSKQDPPSSKRDRNYDHVTPLDFGQEGEDDVFLPPSQPTNNNLRRATRSAENLSPNRRKYEKVRHKSDVTRREELKPFLADDVHTVPPNLNKRRLLSYNGDFSASDTWSYKSNKQSSSSNASHNNTGNKNRESILSMSETDEEVAKVFEKDNQQNEADNSNKGNIPIVDFQSTAVDPPIPMPRCKPPNISENLNDGRPMRKSDTEVPTLNQPIETRRARPVLRPLLGTHGGQNARNYSCESLPSWKGVFLDQQQRNRVNSDNTVLSDKNPIWFDHKHKPLLGSVRLISGNTGKRTRPVIPQMQTKIKTNSALPAYKDVVNTGIAITPKQPPCIITSHDMTSRDNIPHDLAFTYRDRNNRIMIGPPPAYCRTSLPTPPDSSPDEGEKYSSKPMSLRLPQAFSSVDSINSRLDALCDSPLTPGGSEDRFSTLV